MVHQLQVHQLQVHQLSIQETSIIRGMMDMQIRLKIQVHQIRMICTLRMIQRKSLQTILRKQQHHRCLIHFKHQVALGVLSKIQMNHLNLMGIGIIVNLRIQHQLIILMISTVLQISLMMVLGHRWVHHLRQVSVQHLRQVSVQQARVLLRLQFHQHQIM